jgi:hypothetical protein
MTLYDPTRKRLVLGNSLDETTGHNIGLILIERPLPEQPTRRLLLQIGSFFLWRLSLNRVGGGDIHRDPYAGCKDGAEHH